MTQSYKNIKNSASRDFKSYSLQSDLPLSGVTDGTIAFVEQTSTVYVFDDGAWYGIRLKNDPPVINAVPPAKVIVTRGTTYAFSLDAEDPDGLPVTWSYEIIEGNNSGLNISLVGNEFTLTNNTSGKAVIIQFSVTDTSNTVTSTTRFVLDDMEGLQGTNLFRSSTINIPFNDADFLYDPYGFQYDSSVPRTARIDVDSGGTRRISYNDSTNLSQTPTDAYISPSRPTFLANGRIFSIQSNDSNKVTEYIVTDNGPGYTTTKLDIASTSGLFMFPNINSFYVENNNTVYIAGYDNNSYTSLKLYKYFITETAQSAWTELANKSYQIESGVDLHSPAYLKVKGNRVIMLMNSSGGSTKNGQIIIFDKSNLDVLGVYDATPLAWSRDIAACENFIIQHGSGRMWDISDPENITEVTGLTWPTDVENFYLDSERLVAVDGYVQPANGDAKAYLYDFDSLRGTITNTGVETTIERPYFSGVQIVGVMVEDTLYLGGQSSDTVDSLYQAYVYRLQTTVATPPTTDDVPTTLTVYLGEDNTFDIVGQEASDRTVRYFANVLSGSVPSGDGVTVDQNTGAVTVSHDRESDYAYTAQFVLTDSQNESTTYNSVITVSNQQGPGATLSGATTAESGYYLRDVAFLDGVSGYPGAMFVVGDRYVGMFMDQGWEIVDFDQTKPNSTTWSVLPGNFSIVGIYAVSNSEVYRITNTSVFKTSITAMDGGTQVYNSATSIDNNNAGTVVRLDAYNPDYLWVLGLTAGVLTKFNISDPNAWTAEEISAGSLGGTIQNDDFMWGDINDKYAFWHGQLNQVEANGWYAPQLLVRTLSNSTVRYYDLHQHFYMTTTNIGANNVRFAASRDYLFVTPGIGTNYIMRSDGTYAGGRIFIFRINDSGSNPLTLVDTYDLGNYAGLASTRVNDMKFVDGVLYISLYYGTTVIVSAQFDYNTGTISSHNVRASNLNNLYTHIAVGTDGVYHSGELGNGDAYLEKFRSA